MAALSFGEARRVILDRVSGACAGAAAEAVSLLDCAGRVLAVDARADRDYPPQARSVRDGFALRAGDAPGVLRIAGEVRAGDACDIVLEPGCAVEIMTGAPVPPGADAVIMIEHVRVANGTVAIERAVHAGDCINPRGGESHAGDVVVRRGTRLGYVETAMLASIGWQRAPVFRRPRVAILATGDELVGLDTPPEPHQIRNSNSYSLAAQVRRAGGEPVILPVAPDTVEGTSALLERGFACDLLLLSGGVSAGKYDVVETALAACGAEFFFDRVLIQPGQPLVFGRARGVFFFGLPGNPASTMVCCELFARPAIELLGGEEEPVLPLLEATLSKDFHHKRGLTRFLPARLEADGTTLTPLGWSGSSDVPALARANCFLVAEPDRAEYRAGDRIRVLLR